MSGARPWTRTWFRLSMRGQANISYILAEVEYLHKPSISYMLTGNFNLQTRQLMRARATQYIEKYRRDLVGKTLSLARPLLTGSRRPSGHEAFGRLVDRAFPGNARLRA